MISHVKLTMCCCFLFCIRSKETKVSKNVEFQFLTKLLQLVGCHTVATEKEPTDGDTQSSQMEWSVDDAIEWQALVKELYKPSVVSPSESMDAGIPLKVLAAVANCLDLALKYNVYQVGVWLLYSSGDRCIELVLL